MSSVYIYMRIFTRNALITISIKPTGDGDYKTLFKSE